MAVAVYGWTDCWNDVCPTASFTEDRQRALVERVKKRQYNFSFQMFMNPYMTPVYSDKSKCILTKQQWDNVLAEAYGDQPMPPRLTPADILTFRADDILWEKEKFYKE